jgi:hypothetical protein
MPGASALNTARRWRVRPLAALGRVSTTYHFEDSLSRLRERVRVRAIQLEQNGFEHTLWMLQYVVIPEPDHSPTLSVQMRGPAAIRFVSSNVLPSIKLDDETSLNAGEIREVWPNRMLSSKAVPRQAPVANMEPKPKLRFGHVLSQHTCAIAGSHASMLRRTNATCDMPEGLRTVRVYPHPDPLPQAGEGTCR